MNPVRSEAVLEVDGAPVTLRLTLAALAEIEEALEADSLPDLALRLSKPTAGQLLLVLRAMARAGGMRDVTRLGEGSVCLRDVMAAVTLLFRELLTGEVPGKPTPGASAGAAG